MSAGKIILLVVFALVMELNFRYYDFKGKQPLSPGRLVYGVMPATMAGAWRWAGQWWGRVAHHRVPVTLLPDHVMLCVPNVVEWENAAPGSPEGDFKADIEVVMRNVAKRHAQPGITFDENKFHYDGGGWIAYASVEGLEIYRSGNRLNVPVDVKEYWSVGWNFRCGNTYRHEEGPEKYRAYAYTFEGEAVKAD